MHPVVVCHQLRSADNLGAIARVMANFGMSSLILSEPVTHDFRGAERLGVKADPVLERFAIAATLPEALDTVVYALGTTSRTSLKRQAVLSPEEGVRRLAQHSTRGRVALVLGGEKRGLSDDELACCHDVVAIPTVGPQPSMNVAQAAAVLLYLCAREGEPTAPGDTEAGADGAMLRRLEARLEAALDACGFLNAQAPQHALKALTRSLVHGRLTAQEAAMWVSALEHVRRVTSERSP